MIMKRFILFYLLPILILSQELKTRTQALMGTFVHISLLGQYNKQISQSFTLIKQIEHSLSSYDTKATVYKLNHEHQVLHDGYLAEALQESKRYYHDTDGYFDITIGSISKDLYHFGEENSTVPSQIALQNARVDMDAIEINSTSIKSKNYISIDLGGMGKGYAVDKVANFLKEQNISQGIVALSGDIRCLSICTFALQSPYSEQTFATLQSLRPQLSISTSGTYRRYVGSQKNHHLFNPKTHKQGRIFVSVSLFTQGDNTKIDAYATAISVMSKEKALDFLKAHDELGFVLVQSNAQIIYGNLEKFVTLTWLDYKDKATITNISKSTNTKSAIVSSFIHPDTSKPKEINK